MGWDFDLMGMGGMLQSYRGHFFLCTVHEWNRYEESRLDVLGLCIVCKTRCWSSLVAIYHMPYAIYLRTQNS